MLDFKSFGAASAILVGPVKFSLLRLDPLKQAVLLVEAMNLKIRLRNVGLSAPVGPMIDLMLSVSTAGLKPSTVWNPLKFLRKSCTSRILLIRKESKHVG